MGDILLDAHVKMGEMLEAIDKSDSKLKGKDRGSKGGTTKKTLPKGIDKKQSHEAQIELKTWKNARYHNFHIS